MALLKLIPIKVWLLALAGLAGWYVLHQAKEIGELEAQNQQWQIANEHWATAWASREKELENAQQRMIRREEHYQAIEDITNEYRKKTAELVDTSGCLDRDLGNDYWLSISASAKRTTPGMPGDKQGAIETDTDP